MQCRNCGAPISVGALKCNNCHSGTGNVMLTNPVPPCDMYGRKIIAFSPDENKSKARMSYMQRERLYSGIQDIRIINLLNKKAYYYVNSCVIGYSLFVKETSDIWGNVTQYFTSHEIDRRNIRGIGYDSKYGEYIIYLYNPVYVDYSLPPTTEFRLQDIFDDGKLSIVLKCNLPAKNMMF